MYGVGTLSLTQRGSSGTEMIPEPVLGTAPKPAKVMGVCISMMSEYGLSLYGDVFGRESFLEKALSGAQGVW